MERHKQTSFFVDRKTDRLFNLIAAEHGFNNRGEVAAAAVQFLDAVRTQTNYPLEIKNSLNSIFENIANKVQRPVEHGWTDNGEARSLLIDSHKCEKIEVGVGTNEEE